MSYDNWKTTNPADEELGSVEQVDDPGDPNFYVVEPVDRRRYATIMGHCPDCNSDLYGPEARCYSCHPDEDINF